jgi:branched-chain amino acid transport system substrate-binding protein
MTQVAKRRIIPPPIVFILLGFGATVVWFSGMTRFKNPIAPLSSNERMSLGDRQLIGAQTTPEKQAGIEAFAQGDYDTAMTKFQASLQKQRNDAETVIYFNNAKAGKDALRIAVSVPIGSNLDVAQEILRGVAQAQDEANQRGIGGGALQVQIVNDENDPEIVRQVAQDLVSDRHILAVIGHNASNASLVGAPIYQKGELVMITPTSFANGLSGFGSYIFRAAPTIRFMADPLADYVIGTARKTSLAVCYDSQAPDNLSFKNEFEAAFISKGGRLISIGCDFSAPTFNPTQAISEAISRGADGLLITPHVDRLAQAMTLAQSNKGRLSLFGSPTLYTIKTLQSGQRDANGLVLPVPWHPLVHSNRAFPKQAQQRWGGTVNWRTATAYDATRAIITALKPGMSRSDLQKALRSPGFSAEGSGDRIQFLPTGDRVMTPTLVQVQPVKSGYTFVPLRSSNR